MNNRLALRMVMALGLAAAVMGGCQARQDFPETEAGWHSEDYGVVFGRLVQVAAAEPEEAPTWAVRFGERKEAYGGELALTPGAMMAGFGKGDVVEVRGRIVGEAAGGGRGDAMRGIHYAVDSIRLWAGYRE